MEPKYTAQRIEDTANAWLVIEIETEKKQIVFCNAAASTAEDAVALVEEQADA
jgi:hypothetical protein